MSDIINELYPIALDCCINTDAFWNSSFGDIIDEIDSYRRREKYKQKQQAIHAHNLAQQIIEGINLIVNGDDNQKELHGLWDYYPDLFEEEKEKHKKQQEYNEFENLKAQRRKFANYHNRKYGGGENR